MSLSGKIVCFTGTLSISRAVAKAQAESAGAKVGGSVTKNTDYLVAGPGSGKKSADAVNKGVTVWTEEEFHAALKSGGSGKSSKGPKKAAAKKSKKAAPKAEPEEDDDIDWSKLKVAELRAACSSRGLETGGTKAVLLARLEENSVLKEDWATYTVPQLRAACVERGLAKSGSKAVLIAKLEGSTPAAAPAPAKKGKRKAKAISTQENLELLRAIYDGNLGRMMRAIDGGADVNWHNPDHWLMWTPLHEAASHLRPEVICLLVSLGADPSARDKSNSTPLDVVKEQLDKYKEQLDVLNSRATHRCVRVLEALTLAWNSELHPGLSPLLRAWVRELLLIGKHGQFLFETPPVGGDAETGFVYALDVHVKPTYAFQDALNLVALGSWLPPTPVLAREAQATAARAAAAAAAAVAPAATSSTAPAVAAPAVAGSSSTALAAPSPATCDGSATAAAASASSASQSNSGGEKSSRVGPRAEAEEARDSKRPKITADAADATALGQLMAMGFGEDAATTALQVCHNKVEDAANLLLSGL